ncbi:MAG: GtrA family protein [Ferruginibacter sp.]
MKQKLTKALDLFYPPLKKIMPIQTFRYAACGGANTLLALVIYYIGYHFIFVRQNFSLGVFAFKPHIAALFLSSLITFIVGFLLNRYVVFVDSYLKGRIQLFRYFISFFSNLVINYGLLKLLVEAAHWNAMISQVLTTGVVIAISYFTQRHFTFRVKKDGHAEFSKLE